MWIVKVALQRPYTFIMLAVLIVLMGTYAILRTATDIFPNIKIPIAAVIWRYNGILPEEIANRIVLFSERAAQTTVNEAQLYDVGNTILRTQLATVAGASIPFPYGGKQRQIQVDLDPQALRANALSANDVVSAVGQQNLILPAGTQKIGPLEYFIKLNASPTQIEELNNMPVRAQNGTLTYIHDVAHVRDGYSPQTNMVRVDGRRSVLMSPYCPTIGSKRIKPLRDDSS